MSPTQAANKNFSLPYVGRTMEPMTDEQLAAEQVNVIELLAKYGFCMKPIAPQLQSIPVHHVEAPQPVGLLGRIRSALHL